MREEILDCKINYLYSRKDLWKTRSHSLSNDGKEKERI